MDITTLVTQVAKDVGIDDNTLDYVLRRFRAEGMSFLSVTLPAFSKHVVRCIECGFFNSPDHPETVWTSFEKQRWGCIPLLFKVQLCGLFSNSGKLRSLPDPCALLAIRQFCEYFYKLSMEFTPKQLNKAIEKYKSTEVQLSSQSLDFGALGPLIAFIATNYLKNLPSYDQITARFRPRDTRGTFAGSHVLKGITPSKFRLTVRSSHLIPDSRRANVGQFRPSALYKRYQALRGGTTLIKDATNVCEVLFVPKDSRGPRVISKEPLSRLKLQMSFNDFLAGHLEKVTSYRINFKDQMKNQELARNGSVTRQWSTFDLKDASDRVHIDLVRRVFRHTPLSIFLDFRSEFASLPSGEIVQLKKLAGMGSGLTFPTMALLIHAAVSFRIAKRIGSVKKAMRMVYVYGDDLVVPTRYKALVEPALLSVGLLLNADKCFSEGPFRESCGGDYLNGVPVSPVRLRLDSCRIPDHKGLTRMGALPGLKNDMGCLQYIKHAQELQKNLMENTADLFYNAAERYLKVDRLPRVVKDSASLGRLGSSFEILSIPESFDFVFVPAKERTGVLDLNMATARKRYGTYALDTTRIYIESLKRLDDPESTPFSGIGIPRLGSIKRVPGSHCRRLVIGDVLET